MPKNKWTPISRRINYNQDINTSTQNLTKETFILGLHIDIIKKIVDAKMLDIQKKQQRILKDLYSKKEKLNKISTKHSDKILRANKRLDKLMLELKRKIQMLVSKINFHLQNITALNNSYLEPLSDQIGHGIKHIRNEMKNDFRKILNNKEINQAFHEIARSIKFDLYNYSQSSNKKIDYLNLSRNAYTKR
jgi:hypothetical protein